MLAMLFGLLLVPPADTVYAVTIRTGPAWDQSKPPTEQVHFRTHSQNLFRLREEGRIVLGGRFGDVGLILVRAANLDDARRLFAADSSLAAGVFRAEFQVWRTVFEGAVERPPPR